MRNLSSQKCLLELDTWAVRTMAGPCRRFYRQARRDTVSRDPSFLACDFCITSTLRVALVND
jgi:hypothetical protein